MNSILRRLIKFKIKIKTDYIVPTVATVLVTIAAHFTAHAATIATTPNAA